VAENLLVHDLALLEAEALDEILAGIAVHRRWGGVQEAGLRDLEVEVGNFELGSGGAVALVDSGILAISAPVSELVDFSVILAVKTTTNNHNEQAEERKEERCVEYQCVGMCLGYQAEVQFGSGLQMSDLLASIIAQQASHQGLVTAWKLW
jgi:hypothetical protein